LVGESEFFDVAVIFISQKMAQMAMCHWPMCHAIM
jgi:hypothetical protein